MRDSIGGAFMIYVLIIFLAVYIVFVAVAFNYARAFRVKNKIIDIIEQNEGIKEMQDDNSNLEGITSGVFGEIDIYLSNVSYRVNGISKEKNCSDYDYVNTIRGYCIDQVGPSTTTNGGLSISYYKVRTFAYIEFPFFNLNFAIPIQGETRKIERIVT